MFRKMPTENNGEFKEVPSDVMLNIIENSGNENLSRIGRLNKFFGQLSKDQHLKIEKNLFILYVIMMKNYDYYYHGDDSIYINSDINQGSIRNFLDQKLIHSREAFLKEANIKLEKFLIPSETQLYKKQFDDLILSHDIVNIQPEALHAFLYALCFVGATNALEIFIKKYPNAINSLSIDQFNSICVAASANHLCPFMSYLCDQKKSIDEYCIVSNSMGGAMVTPLIAACLRVSQNTFVLNPIRIDRAKQIIELLIKNNADPSKNYVYDDLSDEFLINKLNDGGGHSIIEECEKALEILPVGTNETRVFEDFLKFVISKKPSVSETPHFSI